MGNHSQQIAKYILAYKLRKTRPPFVRERGRECVRNVNSLLCYYTTSRATTSSRFLAADEITKSQDQDQDPQNMLLVKNQ